MALLASHRRFVPCYKKEEPGNPDEVFNKANNMVRDTLEQIDVTKQLAAQYSEVSGYEKGEYIFWAAPSSSLLPDMYRTLLLLYRHLKYKLISKMAKLVI